MTHKNDKKEHQHQPLAAEVRYHQAVWAAYHTVQEDALTTEIWDWDKLANRNLTSEERPSYIKKEFEKKLSALNKKSEYAAVTTKFADFKDAKPFVEEVNRFFQRMLGGKHDISKSFVKWDKEGSPALVAKGETFTFDHVSSDPTATLILVIVNQEATPQTIECLVRLGADVNRAYDVGRLNKPNCPIAAAAFTGNKELVEKLVAMGAREIGNALIHVPRGHEELEQYLKRLQQPTAVVELSSSSSTTSTVSTSSSLNPQAVPPSSSETTPSAGGKPETKDLETQQLEGEAAALAAEEAALQLEESKRAPQPHVKRANYYKLVFEDKQLDGSKLQAHGKMYPHLEKFYSNPYFGSVKEVNEQRAIFQKLQTALLGMGFIKRDEEVLADPDTALMRILLGKVATREMVEFLIRIGADVTRPHPSLKVVNRSPFPIDAAILTDNTNLVGVLHNAGASLTAHSASIAGDFSTTQMQGFIASDRFTKLSISGLPASGRISTSSTPSTPSRTSSASVSTSRDSIGSSPDAARDDSKATDSPRESKEEDFTIEDLQAQLDAEEAAPVAIDPDQTRQYQSLILKQYQAGKLNLRFLEALNSRPTVSSAERFPSTEEGLKQAKLFAGPKVLANIINPPSTLDGLLAFYIGQYPGGRGDAEHVRQAQAARIEALKTVVNDLAQVAGTTTADVLNSASFNSSREKGPLLFQAVGNVHATNELVKALIDLRVDVLARHHTMLASGKIHGRLYIKGAKDDILETLQAAQRAAANLAPAEKKKAENKTEKSPELTPEGQRLQAEMAEMDRAMGPAHGDSKTKDKTKPKNTAVPKPQRTSPPISTQPLATSPFSSTSRTPSPTPAVAQPIARSLTPEEEKREREYKKRVEELKAHKGQMGERLAAIRALPLGKRVKQLQGIDLELDRAQSKLFQEIIEKSIPVVAASNITLDKDINELDDQGKKVLAICQRFLGLSPTDCRLDFKLFTPKGEAIPDAPVIEYLAQYLNERLVRAGDKTDQQAKQLIKGLREEIHVAKDKDDAKGNEKRKSTTGIDGLRKHIAAFITAYERSQVALESSALKREMLSKEWIAVGEQLQQEVQKKETSPEDQVRYTRLLVENVTGEARDLLRPSSRQFTVGGGSTTAFPLFMVLASEKVLKNLNVVKGEQSSKENVEKKVEAGSHAPHPVASLSSGMCFTDTHGRQISRPEYALGIEEAKLAAQQRTEELAAEGNRDEARERLAQSPNDVLLQGLLRQTELVLEATRAKTKFLLAEQKLKHYQERKKYIDQELPNLKIEKEERQAEKTKLVALSSDQEKRDPVKLSQVNDRLAVLEQLIQAAEKEQPLLTTPGFLEAAQTDFDAAKKKRVLAKQQRDNLTPFINEVIRERSIALPKKKEKQKSILGTFRRKSQPEVILSPAEAALKAALEQQPQDRESKLTRQGDEPKAPQPTVPPVSSITTSTSSSSSSSVSSEQPQPTVQLVAPPLLSVRFKKPVVGGEPKPVPSEPISSHTTTTSPQQSDVGHVEGVSNKPSTPTPTSEVTVEEGGVGAKEMKQFQEESDSNNAGTPAENPVSSTNTRLVAPPLLSARIKKPVVPSDTKSSPSNTDNGQLPQATVLPISGEQPQPTENTVFSSSSSSVPARGVSILELHAQKIAECVRSNLNEFPLNKAVEPGFPVPKDLASRADKVMEALGAKAGGQDIWNHVRDLIGDVKEILESVVTLPSLTLDNINKIRVITETLRNSVTAILESNFVSIHSLTAMRLAVLRRGFDRLEKALNEHPSVTSPQQSDVGGVGGVSNRSSTPTNEVTVEEGDVGAKEMKQFQEESDSNNTGTPEIEQAKRNIVNSLTSGDSAASKRKNLQAAIDSFLKLHQNQQERTQRTPGDYLSDYLNSPIPGDEKEDRLLHKAVTVDNLEIVNLLLENGARPGVKNKLGDSPLHIVAREGRLGGIFKALWKKMLPASQTQLISAAEASLKTLNFDDKVIQFIKAQPVPTGSTPGADPSLSSSLSSSVTTANNVGAHDAKLEMPIEGGSKESKKEVSDAGHHYLKDLYHYLFKAETENRTLTEGDIASFNGTKTEGGDFLYWRANMLTFSRAKKLVPAVHNIAKTVYGKAPGTEGFDRIVDSIFTNPGLVLKEAERAGNLDLMLVRNLKLLGADVSTTAAYFTRIYKRDLCRYLLKAEAEDHTLTEGDITNFNGTKTAGEEVYELADKLDLSRARELVLAVRNVAKTVYETAPGTQEFVGRVDLIFANPDLVLKAAESAGKLSSPTLVGELGLLGADLSAGKFAHSSNFSSSEEAAKTKKIQETKAKQAAGKLEEKETRAKQEAKARQEAKEQLSQRTKNQVEALCKLDLSNYFAQIDGTLQYEKILGNQEDAASTALMLAILSGKVSPELVDFLVGKGADVNKVHDLKSNWGVAKCPIDAAIKANNLTIVQHVSNWHGARFTNDSLSLISVKDRSRLFSLGPTIRSVVRGGLATSAETRSIGARYAEQQEAKEAAKVKAKQDAIKAETKAKQEAKEKLAAAEREKELTAPAIRRATIHQQVDDHAGIQLRKLCGIDLSDFFTQINGAPVVKGQKLQFGEVLANHEDAASTALMLAILTHKADPGLIEFLVKEEEGTKEKGADVNKVHNVKPSYANTPLGAAMRWKNQAVIEILQWRDAHLPADAPAPSESRSSMSSSVSMSDSTTETNDSRTPSLSSAGPQLPVSPSEAKKSESTQPDTSPIPGELPISSLDGVPLSPLRPQVAVVKPKPTEELIANIGSWLGELDTLSKKIVEQPTGKRPANEREAIISKGELIVSHNAKQALSKALAAAKEPYAGTTKDTYPLLMKKFLSCLHVVTTALLGGKINGENQPAADGRWQVQLELLRGLDSIFTPLLDKESPFQLSKEQIQALRNFYIYLNPQIVRYELDEAKEQKQQQAGKQAVEVAVGRQVIKSDLEKVIAGGYTQKARELFLSFPISKYDDRYQLVDSAKALLRMEVEENGPDVVEHVQSILDKLRVEDWKNVINFRDPNDNGNTLLHIAVDAGNYEVMELLLKRGADHFVTNNKGELPGECLGDDEPSELSHKNVWRRLKPAISTTSSITTTSAPAIPVVPPQAEAPKPQPPKPEPVVERKVEVTAAPLLATKAAIKLHEIEQLLNPANAADDRLHFKLAKARLELNKIMAESQVGASSLSAPRTPEKGQGRKSPFNLFRRGSVSESATSETKATPSAAPAIATDPLVPRYNAVLAGCDRVLPPTSLNKQQAQQLYDTVVADGKMLMPVAPVTTVQSTINSQANTRSADFKKFSGATEIKPEDADKFLLQQRSAIIDRTSKVISVAGIGKVRVYYPNTPAEFENFAKGLGAARGALEIIRQAPESQLSASERTALIKKVIQATNTFYDAVGEGKSVEVARDTLQQALVGIVANSSLYKGVDVNKALKYATRAIQIAANVLHVTTFHDETVCRLQPGVSHDAKAAASNNWIMEIERPVTRSHDSTLGNNPWANYATQPWFIELHKRLTGEYPKTGQASFLHRFIEAHWAELQLVSFSSPEYAIPGAVNATHETRVQIVNGRVGGVVPIITHTREDVGTPFTVKGEGLKAHALREHVPEVRKQIAIYNHLSTIIGERGEILRARLQQMLNSGMAPEHIRAVLHHTLIAGRDGSVFGDKKAVGDAVKAWLDVHPIFYKQKLAPETGYEVVVSDQQTARNLLRQGYRSFSFIDKAVRNDVVNNQDVNLLDKNFNAFVGMAQPKPLLVQIANRIGSQAKIYLHGMSAAIDEIQRKWEAQKAADQRKEVERIGADDWNPIVGSLLSHLNQVDLQQLRMALDQLMNAGPTGEEAYALQQLYSGVAHALQELQQLSASNSSAGVQPKTKSELTQERIVGELRQLDIPQNTATLIKDILGLSGEIASLTLLTQAMTQIGKASQKDSTCDPQQTAVATAIIARLMSVSVGGGQDGSDDARKLNALVNLNLMAFEKWGKILFYDDSIKLDFIENKPVLTHTSKDRMETLDIEDPVIVAAFAHVQPESAGQSSSSAQTLRQRFTQIARVFSSPKKNTTEEVTPDSTVGSPTAIPLTPQKQEKKKGPSYMSVEAILSEPPSSLSSSSSYVVVESKQPQPSEPPVTVISLSSQGSTPALNAGHDLLPDTDTTPKTTVTSSEAEAKAEEPVVDVEVADFSDLIAEGDQARAAAAIEAKKQSPEKTPAPENVATGPKSVSSTTTGTPPPLPTTPTPAMPQPKPASGSGSENVATGPKSVGSSTTGTPPPLPTTPTPAMPQPKPASGFGSENVAIVPALDAKKQKPTDQKGTSLERLDVAIGYARGKIEVSKTEEKKERSTTPEQKHAGQFASYLMFKFSSSEQAETFRDAVREKYGLAVGHSSAGTAVSQNPIADIMQDDKSCTVRLNRPDQIRGPFTLAATELALEQLCREQFRNNELVFNHATMGRPFFAAFKEVQTTLAALAQKSGISPSQEEVNVKDTAIVTALGAGWIKTNFDVVFDELVTQNKLSELESIDEFRGAWQLFAHIGALSAYPVYPNRAISSAEETPPAPSVTPPVTPSVTTPDSGESKRTPSSSTTSTTGTPLSTPDKKGALNSPADISRRLGGDSSRRRSNAPDVKLSGLHPLPERQQYVDAKPVDRPHVEEVKRPAMNEVKAGQVGETKEQWDAKQAAYEAAHKAWKHESDAYPENLRKYEEEQAHYDVALKAYKDYQAGLEAKNAEEAKRFAENEEQRRKYNAYLPKARNYEAWEEAKQQHDAILERKEHPAEKKHAVCDGDAPSDEAKDDYRAKLAGYRAAFESVRAAKASYDKKAIFRLAANGDKEGMEWFFAAGGPGAAADFDINAIDENGHTALMYVVANGKQEAVKYLLAHDGINVNAQVPAGYPNLGLSALQYAVQRNDTEMVETLCKAGADAGFALREAAKRGHEDIVKMLLAGPEIPQVDKDHALYYAVERGHPNVARNLLVADANANFSPAEEKAVAAGGGEEAKAIDRPLHLAVRHRDAQLVAALLARGADPNLPGVQIASPGGVDLPPEENNSALMRATLMVRTDMMVALRAAGAQCDRPLQVAVQQGWWVLARLLVASQEELRRQPSEVSTEFERNLDNINGTPLNGAPLNEAPLNEAPRGDALPSAANMAALNERRPVEPQKFDDVPGLAAAMYQVVNHLGNPQGMTLQVAARRKIVLRLRELGAPLEHAGQNVLLLAARRGDMPTVQTLIGRGENVAEIIAAINKVEDGNDENNALIHAVRHNNLEMVQKFLEFHGREGHFINPAHLSRALNMAAGRENTNIPDGAANEAAADERNKKVGQNQTNVAIIQALRRAGATSDSALIEAARAGRLQAVKALVVKAKADDVEPDNVEAEDVGAINQAINLNGQDVQGHDSLYYLVEGASWENNPVRRTDFIRVIHLLCHRGANREQALVHAARCGDLELMRAILEPVAPLGLAVVPLRPLGMGPVIAMQPQLGVSIPNPQQNPPACAHVLSAALQAAVIANKAAAIPELVRVARDNHVIFDPQWLYSQFQRALGRIGGIRGYRNPAMARALKQAFVAQHPQIAQQLFAPERLNGWVMKAGARDDWAMVQALRDLADTGHTPEAVLREQAEAAGEAIPEVDLSIGLAGQHVFIAEQIERFKAHAAADVGQPGHMGDVNGGLREAFTELDYNFLLNPLLITANATSNAVRELNQLLSRGQRTAVIAAVRDNLQRMEGDFVANARNAVRQQLGDAPQEQVEKLAKAALTVAAQTLLTEVRRREVNADARDTVNAAIDNAIHSATRAHLADNPNPLAPLRAVFDGAEAQIQQYPQLFANDEPELFENNEVRRLSWAVTALVASTINRDDMRAALGAVNDVASVDAADAAIKKEREKAESAEFERKAKVAALGAFLIGAGSAAGMVARVGQTAVPWAEAMFSAGKPFLRDLGLYTVPVLAGGASTMSQGLESAHANSPLHRGPAVRVFAAKDRVDSIVHGLGKDRTGHNKLEPTDLVDEHGKVNESLRYALIELIEARVHYVLLQGQNQPQHRHEDGNAYAQRNEALTNHSVHQLIQLRNKLRDTNLVGQNNALTLREWEYLGLTYASAIAFETGEVPVANQSRWQRWWHQTGKRVGALFGAAAVATTGLILYSESFDSNYWLTQLLRSDIEGDVGSPSGDYIEDQDRELSIEQRLGAALGAVGGLSMAIAFALLSYAYQRDAARSKDYKASEERLKLVEKHMLAVQARQPRPTDYDQGAKVVYDQLDQIPVVSTLTKLTRRALGLAGWAIYTAAYAAGYLVNLSLSIAKFFTGHGWLWGRRGFLLVNMPSFGWPPTLEKLDRAGHLTLKAALYLPFIALDKLHFWDVPWVYQTDKTWAELTPGQKAGRVLEIIIGRFIIAAFYMAATFLVGYPLSRPKGLPAFVEAQHNYRETLLKQSWRTSKFWKGVGLTIAYGTKRLLGGNYHVRSDNYQRFAWQSIFPMKPDMRWWQKLPRLVGRILLTPFALAFNMVPKTWPWKWSLGQWGSFLANAGAIIVGSLIIVGFIGFFLTAGSPATLVGALIFTGLTIATSTVVILAISTVWHRLRTFFANTFSNAEREVKAEQQNPNPGPVANQNQIVEVNEEVNVEPLVGWQPLPEENPVAAVADNACPSPLAQAPNVPPEPVVEKPAPVEPPAGGRPDGAAPDPGLPPTPPTLPGPEPTGPEPFRPVRDISNLDYRVALLRQMKAEFDKELTIPQGDSRAQDRRWLKFAADAKVCRDKLDQGAGGLGINYYAGTKDTIKDDKDINGFMKRTADYLAEAEPLLNGVRHFRPHELREEVGKQFRHGMNPAVFVPLPPVPRPETYNESHEVTKREYNPYELDSYLREGEEPLNPKQNYEIRIQRYKELMSDFEFERAASNPSGFTNLEAQLRLELLELDKIKTRSEALRAHYADNPDFSGLVANAEKVKSAITNMQQDFAGNFQAKKYRILLKHFGMEVHNAFAQSDGDRTANKGVALQAAITELKKLVQSIADSRLIDSQNIELGRAYTDLLMLSVMLLEVVKARHAYSDALSKSGLSHTIPSLAKALNEAVGNAKDIATSTQSWAQYVPNLLDSENGIVGWLERHPKTEAGNKVRRTPSPMPPATGKPATPTPAVAGPRFGSDMGSPVSSASTSRAGATVEDVGPREGKEAEDVFDNSEGDDDFVTSSEDAAPVTPPDENRTMSDGASSEAGSPRTMSPDSTQQFASRTTSGGFGSFFNRGKARAEASQQPKPKPEPKQEVAVFADPLLETDEAKIAWNQLKAYENTFKADKTALIALQKSLQDSSYSATDAEKELVNKYNDTGESEFSRFVAGINVDKMAETLGNQLKILELLDDAQKAYGENGELATACQLNMPDADATARFY